MKIALVGNQNCGKTTLFNALTGANQHVGNFPGVTVDAKVGYIKNNQDMELVDLPGIYSLSPYSKEEIVTRDFIIKQKPDIIINIVDATNIERNLYLTLQLLELEVPVVMALNMMDEVTLAGNTIKVKTLITKIGIEIVPISASKNQGIDDLLEQVKRVAKQKVTPVITDFCKHDSPVHRAIHAMMTLIEDHIVNAQLPARFACTRIIEGDALILEQLNLSANEKDIVNHVIKQMEKEAGMDNEAALADMRYQFIDDITSNIVIKVKNRTVQQERSMSIDKILTHKWLAFPIFFIIMGLIFYLTFGLIGSFLSDMLEMGIQALINFVNQQFISYGLNEVVRSLIIDGIFAGIGSVLSFLPTIVVLFLFLSLLEDSGYMARVAFMMDRPLRKLGLSGRSFVPMLIGFGCSVPAIMASRTLTSDRDRKMTMMLIPYMSCSAKLPIYGMLTAAFFGWTSPFIMIALYFIGIFVALIVAIISKLLVKSKSVPFMMELPSYRLPGVKTTTLLMWEKAKDFIKKAFTIIFLATIVIWFLQSFDFKLNYIEDSENSILAACSKFINHIFVPLGFGKWQITAALITGLSAKEAVVSTLNVLLGSESAIKELLTSFQAFSLLIFILLYMPCIASFATLKKELNSTFEATCYMVLQTCIAWLCTFIVYQGFGLFIK